VHGSESVVHDVLLALLARRCGDPGYRNDSGDFASRFTGASRRFGRATLSVDADERAQLAAAGITWPICAGVDDLARIAMLLGAAGDPEFTELVQQCYRHGDTAERIAVLRTLPLLPHAERHRPLALDACRTHVRPIFEAVACENPYPACHFPDGSFNQMVLKAVFLEVPLERVVGLAARRTDELARMAGDYARERRAAGRSVSADVVRLRDGGDA
jgi:hypothetical protein